MKPSAMNKPDERLVYLALRSVFVGKDAKIRSVKAIRKQVQKHGQKEDVRELMNNHSEDDVYNTAKQLLESNVFEQTLRAKMRFPEVFSVSPAQSADREQSEEEAARSDANAIKNAAEGCLDEPEPIEAIQEPATEGRQPKKLKYSQQPEFPIPSLYPIYLPFETQHGLLTKVQNTLEHSCYSFAEKYLGEELQRHGWDCPQRVELNKWSRILKKAQFSDESISKLGKPLEALLESIAHLRHTVVHRIHVLESRAHQFLLDAEALTTLLCDDSASKRISHQRVMLELAVDEIRRNKELLSFRATKTIGDLDKKIAEMKRRQQIAVDDMIREDETFRRSALADLDVAVNIQLSEQPGENDATCEEVPEIAAAAENSSDVEIECEKHSSWAQDSS